MFLIFHYNLRAMYFLLALGSFIGIVLVFLRRERIMQQKDSWAKYMLRRLHVKRKAPAETEQVQMVLLTPDQEKQLRDTLTSADAYFESGDLDEAERLYIQVLVLHDANHEANVRLGLIYLKKQLPKKSEAIFRKVLALGGPKDPLVLSNLAFALFLQRNFEEAKEVYKEAIALDPNRSQRYISLAHVYRELEDYPSAVKMIQKAFSLDPQQNEYRLLLAETYFDMGRADDAEKIVQNILKHEDRGSALRRSARVLLKRVENKREQPAAGTLSIPLESTSTISASD